MTDPYAIRSVYYAFVRSRLEYACVIWHLQYEIHARRIESIQKQFLLYALRSFNWPREQLPPYISRCLLLGMDYLRWRRDITSLMYVFDIITGKIDSPKILELIRFNVPSRNLLTNHMFRTAPHRTNYAQNEPICRMLNLFNTYGHLFDFDQSKAAFKRAIIQSCNANANANT